MLTQGRRVKAGPPGIAGNHIVVAISPAGPFVLLAHLRRHSVQVSPGEFVSTGQQVAACGNSGNSTEPHLHVQVSDSTEWDEAHGVPWRFTTIRGALGSLEAPRSSTLERVDVLGSAEGSGFVQEDLRLFVIPSRKRTVEADTRPHGRVRTHDLLEA